LFSGEDKAAHLILFANLSLLWSINIRFDLQMSRSKTVAIVLCLGIIFAALSEWAQDFIPNRAMDIADFQFDMLGVLIGTTLFFFIEKKLKSRKIEL
ncbi:MAG: VanZ family protein, partial [Cyclobacteriaceae bacterium]